MGTYKAANSMAHSSSELLIFWTNQSLLASKALNSLSTLPSLTWPVALSLLRVF